MKNFPAVFLTLSGLIIISFITGAALATFKFFPYNAIQKARVGGKAFIEQLSRQGTSRSTKTWIKNGPPGRGLISHNQAQSFHGYTLYTSTHKQQAFLLAMNGQVVHSWHLPFGEFLDCRSNNGLKPDSAYVYIRRTHVFPNGDILAIIVEAGVTPWGLGLVKLDAHSNIIWSYCKNAHHDFSIGEDGRIYTLTHEIRQEGYKDLPAIRTPFIDDKVVVLSPEGRELQSFSLTDALKKSNWWELCYANGSDKGDFLHANDIEVLTSPLAPAFPFAKPGHLLISMRELNLIGILNPESRSFVWATTGPWMHQHDPDFLPNGNLLLFDNLGRRNRPGGRSRVLEFNPLTHEVVWQFEGNAAYNFYSEVRGCQQRLPNGNTLITLSDAGRIMEVTQSRDVVWEYANTAVHPTDSSLHAAVCGASRLPALYFNDSFLNLIQKN